MSRVYASLPLTGPPSWLGREILRGAQLALERAEDPDVELVVLDGSGERPIKALDDVFPLEVVDGLVVVGSAG